MAGQLNQAYLQTKAQRSAHLPNAIGTGLMTTAHPALLLTGATGFVGRAVRPALEARGWRIRCLTRDAAGARWREPALDWVQGDVADAAACAQALAGCQAALYLVH